MSTENLLYGLAAPGVQRGPAGGQSRKYVAQPINQEQIDKAKETIKETHPLADTPLTQVFPTLGLILRPCTGKQVTESQPLLDNENPFKRQQTSSKKKNVELSQDMKDDPFNFLGFGMVAYRDLMLTLIYLFTILSVVMAPAMYFYSKHGAITVSGYSKYSLGNLGYSSTQCQRSPFDLRKVTMFCAFGYVTNIKHLGINPDGVADRDACFVSDSNQQCYDHINKDFMGKLQALTQAADKDDYSYSFKDEEIFIDPKNTPQACKNEKASLYVQYSCEQSEGLMSRKYKELSYVSSLGVFAAFFFSIAIYFQKRESKMVQLDWDVSTITPGDYTLQYEITDEAYTYFLQSVYYPGNYEAQGIPIGTALKDYLKVELERILTEKLHQLRREQPEETINIKIDAVRIADIQFAFNNAELINLLRLRGGHIMFQRFDKMREVEKQISKLKDEKFMDLTTPVDAFITFEDEDGSIIGQYFEPKFSFGGSKLPADKQFMGTDLYLVESTEPTNIIWENRHWTPADYFKRGIIVFTVIFILIAISFSLIFVCKQYSISIFSKYPTVDCEFLTKIYKSPEDVSLIPTYAQREYTAYYHPTEGQEPTPFSGALQCHCDAIKKGGQSLSDYKAPVTGDKICKDYQKDQYMSLLLGNGVSYMIVAINYVLRLFIIKLIIYLGKDTESEQTRLITNGVFIVQFFNTALLLLMVNANLTEQAGWLGALFNGKISDFNTLWFQDIGKTLIGAMLFNVYWPVLEALVWFGMRTAFRNLDRRFKTCNVNVTKKTTIQQYVELYSGPVFFIHYKYSSILNITFVTMMYGLGIPILFPVAAFSFLTLYCVEKIMIHYSYRQPPMYDEKLNNNVLGLMTYAPLLFLGFGYWMFSSHQLCSNEIYYMDKNTGNRPSGHLWYSVFTSDGYKKDYSLPLIIMFWVFFVLIVFRNKIYKYLAALFPNAVKVGDLEIDEDLDNYFNTIDDNDRNWSIVEEENCRNNLKVKILSDYTLQRFKTTTIGKTHMKGVHCYDILANPLYLDDFQYFSPAMPDREKFIIDDDEDEGNDNAQSDLVKIILNLAFLTQKQAKEFTFSKDAYKLQTQMQGKLGDLFKVNAIN